ncbi:ferritin family protein [Athalassotoga saccharophila]|uniref:ferritin family protein n=1 Tax=Athalassotoga saccharophila TaxID=1441386 RepID=UPI001379B5E8|nr:ferritin family protein [Athalassotoga saccharophila]BBJ28608.1 rubrerythrin [Athalassotoga saccharophila]
MDDGILGILKFALSREIEGMKFYQEKVKSVKDPEVKEVLRQLSEMENDHVNYVRKLIENVEKGRSVSEVKAPDQNPEFFKKRETKEIVGGKIDEIASQLSILRMAYLIEDDFMHFYGDSAEKIEDIDAKNVFKMLSSWEKAHRDILYSLYEEKNKEYWDEMGFTPLF